MRRLIIKLAAALAVAAASFVMMMMLLTGADVLKRVLTGQSLAGTQEMTESLIVAVVWLGMAWAQHTREHVSVDIVTRRVGGRDAGAMRLAGQLIMLGLSLWMLWRTGGNAWNSFDTGEVRFGLLQVPMWPARLSIPLGLAAFVLVVLAQAWEQAQSLRRGGHGASGSAAGGAV
jgi:TRAP-type C4-dicarboxylate transport system permease small subunit